MRRSRDCPTSFWQSLISFVLLETTLKSMTSFSLSNPTLSKNWSRSEKINSNRSTSSQLPNLYQLKSSRCLSLFTLNLVLTPLPFFTDSCSYVRLACTRRIFKSVLRNAQKELQLCSIYYQSCFHLQPCIQRNNCEPQYCALLNFMIGRCWQSCSSNSWQVKSCEAKLGNIENFQLSTLEYHNCFRPQIILNTLHVIANLVGGEMRFVTYCWLQSRSADNEKLSKEIRTLETDNKELSERLVEMKSTEIERMNEVNGICHEMIRNAKNMERAAAAEANSAPQKMIGKLFGSRQSRTSNDLAAVCLFPFYVSIKHTSFVSHELRVYLGRVHLKYCELRAFWARHSLRHLEMAKKNFNRPWSQISTRQLQSLLAIAC